MKKTILMVLTVLLIGCQKTPAKALVKQRVVVAEIVEEVEEINYIEKDQFKALMIKTNSETMVIDLDLLHTQLSDLLLKEVDLSIDIDMQSDLIEDIVYDALKNWRIIVVKKVLESEQVQLNEDDFETLVDRTSISNAYQLMLSYETIFLKQQVK